MMLLVANLYVFAGLLGSEGADHPPRSPPVIEGVPSIDELAQRGGYNATNYEIFTEDGYSLWLHRIGKNRGPPVLIQHGIMVAADSWITRGRNHKDLAFMLLDKGYDVWLSNHRGTFFNEYSKKYPRSDPKFWDFSFHESGIYDLPAAIDKILDERKVKKIAYVGHSLGTVTFTVMCTLRPEYNNKIEVAVLMAPTIYLRPMNRMPPFLRILASMKDFLLGGLTKGDLELRNKKNVNTLNKLCGDQVVKQHLCLGMFGLFAGEGHKNKNAKDWSAFLLHVSGTSLKTLTHLIQLSTDDEFQQFDYGSAENLEKYGSVKPPKYNLKLLTVPVALFWTYSDIFMDEKSLERLENALPNQILSWPIEDKKFTHLDMVIGDSANVLLYPHVINVIDSSKTKYR